jgi:hypothetical protein
MDLGSLVLPGAQSLVAAMLGDTWKSVRSALARRWGHGQDDQTAVAEQHLEQARSQALVLAGDGAERQARLEVFWAGYLVGLLAERPDLADAVRDLGAGTARTSETHNSNTGTVHGNLLQAGDIHGGIRF